MPRLLFYELGRAPSNRSLLELSSLHRNGWSITVAHEPAARNVVQSLGYESFPLPKAPGRNVLLERLTTMDEALRQELSDVADQLTGLRSRTGISDLNARLAELKAAVERTALAVRQHAAAGRRTDEATAKVELNELTAQRKAVAEQIRDARAQMAELARQREGLAARVRAIQAANRVRSPLTAGARFGDLTRLEPTWHLHAPAMATVAADLLWAAGLDALPPVVWAGQAMANRPPVVYDAHDHFTDLDDVPDTYRVAWRQVAATFIPLAAGVFSTSRAAAAALEEEFGARSTLLPKHAAASAAGGDGALRGRLGLDSTTPLAVHLGALSENQNPLALVDLLLGLPELHLAFVGATDAKGGALAEVAGTVRWRGAGDRLHFVPNAPFSQITGLIADADVSVIIYRPDASRGLRLAMPGALYESLAAGVPAVAPQRCAAGEFLLTEGLGRAFEPDNPADLVSAVRAVLTDPSVRGHVRARAPAFTWASIEPELIAMVDRLSQPSEPATAPGRA